MLLAIDNPDPDTIAEQINNAAAPAAHPRFEWVTPQQLAARCEEWSPKRKTLIAATCDAGGVDLFYEID